MKLLKKKGKKTKAKHLKQQSKLFANKLIPRKHLKSNKFKQLRAISRLSILMIKKRDHTGKVKWD